MRGGSWSEWLTRERGRGGGGGGRERWGGSVDGRGREGEGGLGGRYPFTSVKLDPLPRQESHIHIPGDVGHRVWRVVSILHSASRDR